MPTRVPSVLLAGLLLSVMTLAAADVVPRYNNCPNGYYPDGNFCVSRPDRSSMQGYSGSGRGPYQGPPQGRYDGPTSHRQGEPIIEKHGNCPPGYHSNRKGKKCIRDGYED